MYILMTICLKVEVCTPKSFKDALFNAFFSVCIEEDISLHTEQSVAKASEHLTPKLDFKSLLIYLSYNWLEIIHLKYIFL